MMRKTERRKQNMENNMAVKDTAMFNVATLVLQYVTGFEKILKKPVAKIEARGFSFPKTVSLKWIEEGIEFTMAFFDGQVNAQLYVPEDLSESSAEYQERIADCTEMISKIVTERGGGKVEDKENKR
jgi:hypothetical protein